MVAVAEGAEQVGVEGTGSGIGVTLDARNLHQSAHGVAGESQVVFQAHFGSIFDLRRCSAKQLVGSGSSHGASHAHFALAAHVGTRHRCVGFHHQAKQSGGGKGAQDALFGESFGEVQVIEHSRQHAASTASGRGDNLSATGILFAHCQCVGIHQSAALEAAGVAKRFHIVAHGFAANAQSAGQHAFGFDAALHRFFHHLPHLAQIFPDGVAFVHVDVFPERATAVVAPLLDFGDVRQFVHLGACRHLLTFFEDVAAAHRVVGSRAYFKPICVVGMKSHCVWVERQEHVAAPLNFGWSHRRKHVDDGFVGHVALAGGGKRAIKCHLVARHAAVQRQKFLCRAFWSHGVAA